MRWRDVLGVLFEDGQFADLFAARGRPAESPGRLAVISVLQFAEGLTDRQAADAVRLRVDWKYLLGLELDDQGFDASVLTEFRARLADSGRAEALVFDRVLDLLVQADMVAGGGRQRTDSTSVLGQLRALDRLELVGEVLRAALEAATARGGRAAGAGGDHRARRGRVLRSLTPAEHAGAYQLPAGDRSPAPGLGPAVLPGRFRARRA
jgi:transposase